MEKICLRCTSKFSQKEDRANVYKYTFTYLESDVKKFIRETYDNCICTNCQTIINQNFYSSGVNPKFIKQKIQETNYKE